MTPSRNEFAGLPDAILRLSLWFVVFFVVLSLLVPSDLLGWTTPWGLGDLVAGTLLVGGAYHAARYCRLLALHFAFGAAAGLLYVGRTGPGGMT